MAKKALDELLQNRDDIHLEEIEILSKPLRALKDGVRFIPTLKCGKEQLTGILLSYDTIKAFIEKVEQS
ncbi:MAG: hypothetical protein K9K37_04180 [Desulfocapsa sp.]|nr:hypothetical protein [Desulfocapsa sp.]